MCGVDMAPQLRGVLAFEFAVRPDAYVAASTGSAIDPLNRRNAVVTSLLFPIEADRLKLLLVRHSALSSIKHRERDVPHRGSAPYSARHIQQAQTSP